jgi:hypothetical protein
VVYRLGIPEATLAAMSGTFYPSVIVRIDWPEDPVLVHTGRGVLEFGDEDYTGIRRMGGLRLPGDGYGVQIGRGEVTLGGPQEMLDSLMANAPEAQGRDIHVWFGVTTELEGTTFIGSPFQAWAGYLGESEETMQWDGDVATFQISVAIDSQPAPRASATALHNEAERLRAGDTSGRHLRAIGQRVRNTVARSQ